MTDIVLIRHAPAQTEGRVTGRRDVPLADPTDGTAWQVRDAIGKIDAVISSPARRCRQTAEVLFADMTPCIDERLWEQSFGDWEGCAYADLPELGGLPPTKLARHRPPGGESFLDVCTRVAPAIVEASRTSSGRVAIIAHAGSIRAALALALGGDAGSALAFEIAPLSATLLRVLPDGAFAISYVNRIA